jgi:predicted  nucleic acid-binding Zn-ribbon protein
MREIEYLIMLHDLDLLLKELGTPEGRKSYQSIGFKIKDPKKNLAEARKKLARKIPKRLLERYERIQKRHDRALAPVIRGICYGCFIRLPLEMSSRRKNLQHCPNCGRIIYWLD